jgi:hypothetical protein
VYMFESPCRDSDWRFNYSGLTGLLRSKKKEKRIMLRNIEYCAPAQQSKSRYQWQAGWEALRMVPLIRLRTGADEFGGWASMAHGSTGVRRRAETQKQEAAA